MNREVLIRINTIFLGVFLASLAIAVMAGLMWVWGVMNYENLILMKLFGTSLIGLITAAVGFHEMAHYLKLQIGLLNADPLDGVGETLHFAPKGGTL